MLVRSLGPCLGRQVTCTLNYRDILIELLRREEAAFQTGRNLAGGGWTLLLVLQIADVRVVLVERPGVAGGRFDLSWREGNDLRAATLK